MMKFLKGWFVEEKSKALGVATIIIVLLISEFVYCFVLVQKNKSLKLEIQKLTVQVQNPSVVQKPIYKTKYVERIIKKESEPLTLILEREISTENNGGKEVSPLTDGKKPSEHKWTAGVIYDGTVGGVVTRRILGTLEAGALITGKTAGLLATVRFK